MSNTANSELKPPSWLNDAFLETALKTGEKNESIKVISSQIKPATVPGDNYGSDMFRATVQIESGAQKEKRSLIIKTVRSGMTGDIAKILENPGFFGLEVNTFSKAHPAMYELLDRVSMGSNQPFAAKHIFSKNVYPEMAIVLEDLKEDGFKLAERTLGLDMKHCLLVMRTIARYHAASVAISKENHKVIELFLKSPFSDEEIKSMEPFFANCVNTSANEVATWPDYKEYADKLYQLEENALKVWLRPYDELDKEEFKVLNHGDLWANNMMFRYSEVTEEVEEVRFVDFQISRWASPAYDLQYFINASASPEVFENVEVLIEEYHRTLCEILTLLGYQNLKPSLKQLNEDIKSRGLFGLLSAASVRAFALVDRNKVPDLNKLMANEGSIHLTEPYKISLKKLLPLYGKWGWL